MKEDLDITWISPHLKSTLAWWTSSFKAFSKRDGNKEQVPKILLFATHQQKPTKKANPKSQLEGAKASTCETTQPTKR
jgi:hypothetical protein